MMILMFIAILNYTFVRKNRVILWQSIKMRNELGQAQPQRGTLTTKKPGFLGIKTTKFGAGGAENFEKKIAV